MRRTSPAGSCALRVPPPPPQQPASASSLSSSSSTLVAPREGQWTLLPPSSPSPRIKRWVGEKVPTSAKTKEEENELHLATGARSHARSFTNNGKRVAPLFPSSSALAAASASPSTLQHCEALQRDVDVLTARIAAVAEVAKCNSETFAHRRELLLQCLARAHLQRAERSGVVAVAACDVDGSAFPFVDSSVMQRWPEVSEYVARENVERQQLHQLTQLAEAVATSQRVLCELLTETLAQLVECVIPATLKSAKEALIGDDDDDDKNTNQSGSERQFFAQLAQRTETRLQPLRGLLPTLPCRPTMEALREAGKGVKASKTLLQELLSAVDSRLLVLAANLREQLQRTERELEARRQRAKEARERRDAVRQERQRLAEEKAAEERRVQCLANMLTQLKGKRAELCELNDACASVERDVQQLKDERYPDVLSALIEEKERQAQAEAHLQTARNTVKEAAAAEAEAAMAVEVAKETLAVSQARLRVRSEELASVQRHRSEGYAQRDALRVQVAEATQDLDRLRREEVELRELLAQDTACRTREENTLTALEKELRTARETEASLVEEVDALREMKRSLEQTLTNKIAKGGGEV